MLNQQLRTIARVSETSMLASLRKLTNNNTVQKYAYKINIKSSQ